MNFFFVSTVHRIFVEILSRGKNDGQWLSKYGMYGVTDEAGENRKK